MNRHLIRWAMRLYPSAWRDRYGEEFKATLDDMPSPSIATAWDIFKGALLMRTQKAATLKMMLIFGLAGLLMAWGISSRIADQYLSESLLQASSLDRPTLDQSIGQILGRQNLVNLIEKHGLFAPERCCLPLEDLVEMTKKNVSITLKDSNIAVGFKSTDPLIAQRVTSDLATMLTTAQTPGQITILDNASSSMAFYPNRLNLALTGLLAGMLIGGAWAFVKARKAKLAG